MHVYCENSRDMVRTYTVFKREFSIDQAVKKLSVKSEVVKFRFFVPSVKICVLELRVSTFQSQFLAHCLKKDAFLSGSVWWKAFHSAVTIPRNNYIQPIFSSHLDTLSHNQHEIFKLVLIVISSWSVYSYQVKFPGDVQHNNSGASSSVQLVHTTCSFPAVVLPFCFHIDYNTLTSSRASSSDSDIPGNGGYIFGISNMNFLNHHEINIMFSHKQIQQNSTASNSSNIRLANF